MAQVIDTKDLIKKRLELKNEIVTKFQTYVKKIIIIEINYGS
jgi:hypothetical protein